MTTLSSLSAAALHATAVDATVLPTTVLHAATMHASALSASAPHVSAMHAVHAVHAVHAATVHASASSVSYAGWLGAAGPWLLLIVAVFVLIETGLLFPFLPGDTLLFAAAIVAGSAGIPVPVLVAVAAAAAIAGDQLGYMIGRRFGRSLFTDDARILKTRYLLRTDAFFARYGPFAVVLARFAPIVRTFVPPLAGASAMRYRTYLLWNVVGGIAWASLICLAGLLLGTIPFVGSNLDAISVAILVISLAPLGISALRSASRRRRARRAQDAQEKGATEQDQPAPLP